MKRGVEKKKIEAKEEEYQLSPIELEYLEYTGQ